MSAHSAVPQGRKGSMNCPVASASGRVSTAPTAEASVIACSPSMPAVPKRAT
jgi:hypothetical protein